MKPGYKQTEVGVIPEDWESVKAGDIGRFRGGNGFPLRFQGETASGYPFYKVSDMNNEGNDTFMFDSNNWISEGSRKQLGATAFPADSIIFAKVGAAVFLERKKILTKPSCIDNNLCALVLDKARTHVRFVHYSLLNIKFGALVSTTALPSLSGTVLSQISFALPPLPEQRAIATALSDVDGLLGALDRLIAKKRDLKQAAIQQLLTGQTRLPGFKGEWVEKTLPDVSRFRGGKAHEQYIADHGRFVCVNSKFISTEGKIRKYSSANFCSARAKDILMVMSDLPNGKALAKTFVADQDDLYAVNQRVCALTPFEDYCAEFLAYVLDRNPYFLKFDDGVSQTHLLNRVFQKCPVFVPPTKAEQTAIASVLSEMDAELAGLEQRREKTRALKQGMMQELLTGRTRLA